MRWTYLFCGMVLTLSVGCSDINLDNTNWRCESNADCGEGFVCEKASGATANACAQALEGADGVFADRIVLGASASIEPGAPTYGTGAPFISGMEVARDAINKRGGVQGRKIELLASHDGYDPSLAEENAKTYAEGGNRKAFALVGFNGSPTSFVAMNVALENSVVFFGAVSGADVFRKNQRYVFNYRASYVQQVKAAVAYVTQTRSPVIHPRNIALFAQGTGEATDKCTWSDESPGTPTCGDSGTARGKLDGFGKPGFDGVFEALNGSNKYGQNEIIFATYYTPKDEQTVLQPAVNRVLKWLGRPKSKAERNNTATGGFDAAIVLQATNGPASKFVNTLLRIVESIKAGGSHSELSTDEVEEVRKVDKLDFAGVILGPSFAEALGKGGVDKICERINAYALQVVPHPKSGATTALAFQKDADAADRKDVKDNFNGFEGYIVMNLFAAALNRHGRDLTTESFVETLTRYGNIGQDVDLGVPLSFSQDDHQASGTTWFTRLNKNCEFEDLGVTK